MKQATVSHMTAFEKKLSVSAPGGALALMHRLVSLYSQ